MLRKIVRRIPQMLVLFGGSAVMIALSSHDPAEKKFFFIVIAGCIVFGILFFATLGFKEWWRMQEEH